MYRQTISLMLLVFAFITLSNGIVIKKRRQRDLYHVRFPYYFQNPYYQRYHEQTTNSYVMEQHHATADYLTALPRELPTETTMTTLKPSATTLATTETTVAPVTTVNLNQNEDEDRFDPRFSIPENGNGMTTQSEMLRNCANMKRRLLRQACERVAKNPILRAMNGTRGFIGTEELLPIISRGLSITTLPQTLTWCDDAEQCPDYSGGNSNVKKGLLSLSPWTVCQEYDPHRFPQWINTAKCLCQGCIDPLTGKELIGDVMSQELTVEVTVLRKKDLRRLFSQCTRKTCEESIHQVVIGCHCAMPRVV